MRRKPSQRNPSTCARKRRALTRNCVSVGSPSFVNESIFCCNTEPANLDIIKEQQTEREEMCVDHPRSSCFYLHHFHSTLHCSIPRRSNADFRSIQDCSFYYQGTRTEGETETVPLFIPKASRSKFQVSICGKKKRTHTFTKRAKRTVAVDV